MTSPPVPSFAAATLRSRSMGMKLLIVCGLALAMIIPALFVEGLVDDRSKRATDVIRGVSEHVGGQQTFLGPVLAIPYSTPSPAPPEYVKRGIYLVFPSQATGTLKVNTEERRRSLFKVPVFQTSAQLDGTFDLTGVPHGVPQGTELDWDRAEIVVGASDPRGALTDAILKTAGESSTMVPSQISPSISLGADGSTPLKLTLFGSRVQGLGAGSHFSVSSLLHFSGAQRLAVLAYGKSTQISMEGNWPSPGFDGGFLPATRNVTKRGFQATWSVPFIARGIRAEGPSDMITGLDTTALGVSLIEVADPYQSVTRSLKYAPLFLGLVFVSYFIFEVTTGKRVHPAQYVLVGVAQIIFYLLSLSLAERTGFDVGFLLAGAATVALLSTNAGWVFQSQKQGKRAWVIFTLLYTLIYLLLRLEDNALLVGATASFLAVAAAMYFTRDLDWYSSFSGSADAGAGLPSLTKESTL